MRFFSIYKHPTDPRWRGPQKWGPFLMLPITLLFLLNWILFISDLAYSRSLWNKFDAMRKANQSAGRYYDEGISYQDYPPV
jgi:hypothetical protein